MAEQDADRTEEPTAYKLEKARERGSVAKSQDLTGLCMVSALVVALYALPNRAIASLAALVQQTLAMPPDTAWTADASGHWLGLVLREAILLLAPLLLLLGICAVVANLIQVGPMFSPKALKPNPEKLNPVSGMKRFFTLRFVFDSMKAFLKLALLITVTCWVLRDLVPGLLKLINLSPKAYPNLLLGFSQTLTTYLAGVLLLFALVDFGFARWDFRRQMHMSRREVRDELKQREGDPRIRQKLRQLRSELLTRTRSMAQVPRADVLITNPTHIAVALRYESGSSRGPQLLAKGAGELARRMRELAYRSNVPVVENRTLARSLYRELQIDDFIPQKWYPDVARILAWVYLQRETARRAST